MATSMYTHCLIAAQCLRSKKIASFHAIFFQVQLSCTWGGSCRKNWAVWGKILRALEQPPAMASAMALRCPVGTRSSPFARGGASALRPAPLRCSSRLERVSSIHCGPPGVVEGGESGGPAGTVRGRGLAGALRSLLAEKKCRPRRLGLPPRRPPSLGRPGAPADGTPSAVQPGARGAARVSHFTGNPAWAAMWAN